MKFNPYIKSFALLNDENLRLPQDFIESYRQKEVPFGPLGYIVYKRSYARNNEEWVGTLERCINGAQAIGADYTLNEMKQLFDYMFHLKCLFAGRPLWTLGTEIINKYGSTACLNCWACHIRSPEDFCFIMNHLSLGGGVGFSVEAENIFEFPRVKSGVMIERKDTKDADFIVPDSREGWIELLRKVLNSYFYTGKSFSYSTVCIRPSGIPLKVFGGYSSGPRYLVTGITKICEVLDKRVEGKIRPVDALDIANIIAELIVSGAGRRSSEIALGDVDSQAYLRAKRWDLGVPNHRCQSNNSLICNNVENLVSSFWRGYEGGGEPYGLVNRKLIQKQGRLGEKVKDNAELINPCGEIPLSHAEACNLSELFLPNISSLAEMKQCAYLLYKTQKAIAAGWYIYDETNKIVAQNMRLGLSISGYLQCNDRETMDQWLGKTYESLRTYDENYSKQKGCNKSIKLTTVKPSGTISLLAGITPGIHPAYARYYTRRIRMLSSDPLVDLCKRHGYNIEHELKFDGTFDHNTSVISFPIKASEHAMLSDDVSVIDQLNTMKHLQTIWSDNAVSITAYYKLEELDDIKKWLTDHYNNYVKSVSFLLHSDHGFCQAPYEPITEEQYNSAIKRTQPITQISNGGSLLDVECEKGACPAR